MAQAGPAGPGGGTQRWRERRRASLLADPERLELLGVAALGLLSPAAPPVEPERRAAAALDQAVVERELARRTGDLRRLAQAYQAAAVAARDAGSESRLFAAARLQTALTALTAQEVFGDADGAAQAEDAATAAEAALGCQPGRLNGPGLVRARIAGRRALAGLDRDAVMTAAARFEDAALALDARVRATGAGLTDWAAALCEKAELLVGYGSARREMGPLHQAGREMAALRARLDPERLPLSWTRAATLQGASLRALGELSGDARVLKDAAVALGAAYDATPAGHSPLDRARAAHELGLALQALGEASGDAPVYASAQAAFDRALGELGEAATPLRAGFAYDRAACLARRAERAGDLTALAEAEAAFRRELGGGGRPPEPLAWAVTQMALARIYQARAELTGSRGELGDAAFALTEALEVFGEEGCKSLADTAHAALARLRGG